MTHIEKMRVQAQHLESGDIVGSGEVIYGVVRAGINIPTGKVMVTLNDGAKRRTSFWGKYTLIGIERITRTY